jgi:hypothetical protein
VRTELERAASYVIAVRNPDTAVICRARFGTRRKVSEKTPAKVCGPEIRATRPRRTFLDYEGAELIFVGASEDPERELGIEFKSGRETPQTADILKVLQIPREVAREALLEGEWA